jgi:hypothetical protein
LQELDSPGQVQNITTEPVIAALTVEKLENKVSFSIS